MSRHFNSEKEIDELLEAFEAGTIGRAEWKHAEHLTVALCYVSRHGLEEATKKMRSGIMRLLRAFEVDLAKEMPYHETLTVFWMRAVSDFNSSKNGSSILETANELVESFDKEYPLRFYSRELLFSDKARAEFVEPDHIWEDVEFSEKE